MMKMEIGHEHADIVAAAAGDMARVLKQMSAALMSAGIETPTAQTLSIMPTVRLLDGIMRTVEDLNPDGYHVCCRYLVTELAAHIESAKKGVH